MEFDKDSEDNLKGFQRRFCWESKKDSGNPVSEESFENLTKIMEIRQGCWKVFEYDGGNLTMFLDEI